MSGNQLPNPLPPRVRRHSSTAQTRAKRVRRFTEHARGGPVWQCRLCRTPTQRARTAALGDRTEPDPSSLRAASAAPAPRGGRGVDHRPVTDRRVGIRTSRPPESHRARSGPSAPFPAAPHGRGGDTGPSGGIRSLPVAIAPFRTISRPTCPGGAKKRLITRVVRRFNDRITYAQPSIFSQLHTRAHSLPNWPINPLVTRQEETARYASTQRGRAMNARRTSLHALRMKRFVIECFPPSCLVDIAPVGELVTPAPRDAVDSILGIECLGNSCRTEGNSAGATGP